MASIRYTRKTPLSESKSKILLFSEVCIRLKEDKSSNSRVQISGIFIQVTTLQIVITIIMLYVLVSAEKLKWWNKFGNDDDKRFLHREEKNSNSSLKRDFSPLILIHPLIIIAAIINIIFNMF